MGRRGPTPTPTAIKLARGSWRGDAEDKKGPKAKAGKPRMPAWLDPRAKAAWKAIVPELEQLGVLATCDAHALSLLCEAFSEWKQAKIMLAKTPHVKAIHNPDGSLKYLQTNPYVSISRKAGEELLRLLREFGLTPAARTRIEIKANSDQSSEQKDARFTLHRA